MKNKPISTAQRIASRVNKAHVGEGEISSINLSRLLIAKNPITGIDELLLIFPKKSGRSPYQVDVSFLQPFPNLKNLFIEALLKYGFRCGQRTRIETAKLLSIGIFSHLSRCGMEDVQPEELDENYFSHLSIYLQNQNTTRRKGNLHSSDGEPVISKNTVGQRLGVIRYVLSSIDTGPNYAAASAIAARVPSRPGGASQDAHPIETIATETLLQIIDAAEKEVILAAQRLDRAHDYIQRFNRPENLQELIVANGEQLEANIVGLLNYLYPEIVPDLSIIRLQYPWLANKIKKLQGLRYFSAFLQPTARHNVPFVLLMTIQTYFNADSVLLVTEDRISFESLFGVERVIVTAPKGRASQDLKAVRNAAADDDLTPLGFKNMLEILKRMIARLRDLAQHSSSGRIFLFVQETRTKTVKSFGNLESANYGPSSDITWQHNLKRFAEDNNLPEFNLKQIRPTMLNLVQMLGGSLEAAQALGNHADARTTWFHYTGDAVRKLYRAKIGQTMLLRERWWQSNGIIDPRARTSAMDKGAATPGFSCLDPLDSPRPNQIKGKLCRDYGGCPNCPMAAAHPLNPTCVSLYMSLEKALYETYAIMASQTWLARWQPVLTDLKALLARIPDQIKESAIPIMVRLPKVG